VDHLLSHLKLSLPESQQVLTDLSPWMKKSGFLELNGAIGALDGNRGPDEWLSHCYFSAGEGIGGKNRIGLRLLSDP
jgi:hypothetical protein